MLFYLAGATTATRVYGQPGFTTNTFATTATGLISPAGISLAPDGALFVAGR